MIYTDTIHLVADTISELHEFAWQMGLTVFHGVKKGHPHYDVRIGMTRKDIKLGGMIYKVLGAGAQFRTKREILILSWKMLDNELKQDAVDRIRLFQHIEWRKEWIGVEPPKECTGNCKMKDGLMMRTCETCHWSDF